MSDDITAHAQCDDIIGSKDARIAELRDAAVARSAVLVEALNVSLKAMRQAYSHAGNHDCTVGPTHLIQGLESAADAIASTTDAERELLAYKRAWERYRNEPRDAYLDHVADEMDAILKEEQAK